MVLNQASKSVKFALRIVEEQIIEPVIQTFIDYHLMSSTDPTIQGDILAFMHESVSGIVERKRIRSRNWSG